MSVRLTFALLFILVGFQFNFAQKPTIPIDAETGKALYTEVVQVDGVPAAKLHARAVHWFNTYFTNPTSVIKNNDATNNSIDGQHGIYIYNEVNGMKNKAGQVKYRVKIQTRDGRYKYQVYDIFELAAPKVYIEAFLDESAVNKDAQFRYVRQVDEHIKSLIANMKETMSQPLNVEKEDDW